jgi:hypothetical protein
VDKVARQVRVTTPAAHEYVLVPDRPHIPHERLVEFWYLCASPVFAGGGAHEVRHLTHGDRAEKWVTLSRVCVHSSKPVSRRYADEVPSVLGIKPIMPRTSGEL